MPAFSRRSGILAGARQRVAFALLPVAALWLAVLWAAIGGSAPPSAPSAQAAAAVLQTIVAGGQPSPAEGSFDRFGIEGRAVPAPSNRRGDIVFFATLLRSHAEEGLFVIRDGRIAKLVVVGDAMPSGERIAGFGERPAMAINEAGGIAFSASLTGGKATRGIFLAQKGKILAIALSGADAPNISGGTLTEFEPPTLNDGGDVAFLASLRRGRETGEAIYVWRRGTLVKVVGSGDAAPGGGIFSSFASPALNNKGEVAFGALIEQGPILGGIFTGTGRETHALLAAGAPAPTGGIFTRFSERIELNDAGTIVFSAMMRQGGPGSAIFVADNDAPRAIASIGDPAPGGGTLAAFASWPVMSQTGAVAFIASVDGGPNALALYLAGTDGLKRVAAVGDALPDGGRLDAFPLYPSLAIGPDGAITFSATVERNNVRGDELFNYGAPRHK
jgi:hypothetical protein